MARIPAITVLVLMVAGVPAYAQEQDAAAYNASGVELYEAGHWREAIEAFEQAQALAPDNATVKRNLCNAYQAYADQFAQKADFASAADLLEDAIAADPRNPSPLVQLGSYYLRLNMVPDALFRLKEAIELAPEHLDARELLGDAYYRSNNLQAALDQWEWVYATAPDRPGLKEKLEKAYREEAVEGKFREGGSRHFRISYAPGTTYKEQSQVLSLLEQAYVEIGQKFGGVYPPGPVNVIIYTADDFAAATQLGEYVGAVYDGKIRVPLKDKAGHAISQGELRRRLYHEYVHVVVRYLVDDNAPWWLNEGLAETFSQTDGVDYAFLQEAARERGLLPLAQLDGDLLSSTDPETLRLAYAQAHATVKMLWSQFGAGPLAGFLTALAEGANPEQALQERYHRNYALLDREIASRIAKGE